MTVQNAVAFPLLLTGSAEELLCDVNGTHPRQSYDANAALLRDNGGCDRGNCFRLVNRLVVV